MRPLSICTALALFLMLTQSCWAQKSWTIDSEKLSFKLNEDFQKSGQQVPNSFLTLISSAKNVQLVMSPANASKPASASKPKSASKPEKAKAQLITTAIFKKAFPVLIAEARMELVGKPIEMKVSGSPAVIYSLKDESAKEYQTVYAFVGRGKKAYTVILNYPSPFQAGMVDLMKKMLASVKHS